MKILITGGNGYIAKGLVKNLGVGHSIRSISRADFNLEDHFATINWFRDKYFDVVIHTASAGTNDPREMDPSILTRNVMMFTNLVSVAGSYGKLINLCSGASTFLPHTYYGASKKLICDIAMKYDWIYNLRIYGLFDENERPERFIKANIIRYLRHEPMRVYGDKVMDFFYAKDLASLIQYYIRDNNASRLVDCSYVIQPSLSGLARFINSLGNHRVPIFISDSKAEDYCGYSQLPINTIGLHLGVEMTYEQLLRNSYNNV